VPLAALGLVLGAALCHGAWNLILKMERGRLDVGCGALAVAVLVATPALLVYRVTDVPATAWALVLVSGVFETGYFLTLSAAYRVGDLSLVYPVARGTAPVVVAPLAIALLGERPSLTGLAGVALVVVGIFASHARSLLGPPLGRESRRALVLAVITGLMTAGYSLVNKLGVTLVPVPLYALCVFVVDTLLIYLVLWWRGEAVLVARRDPRWLSMIAVGALMMAAYLAVLAAMARAPVTYVVAAREISIVVGALLGALVLRERHPAARIAGALVIFAGLVVIALSR
jgi:drug/metabolite transporter (DMT)-like permease